MTEPFSFPPIQSLQRLQVTDGLLMNADRWRMAHEYHRQRQNLHYQSLNQPGIVTGLGVRLISAPSDVPSLYRDRRWVEIQPGMAIDLAGNPIIVPQPETYRFATPAPQEHPITVYLVVSYVDPDKLRRSTQTDAVRETFRIDEKLTPPKETEVELCRILLAPTQVNLENPVDVFYPSLNQLDLRYRLSACSRPQATVQVAPLANTSTLWNQTASAENLSYFLQSVSGLYPAFNAQELLPIDLKMPNLQAQLQACDLLFLSTEKSFSLSPEELEVLQAYLNSGGHLLIDTPHEAESTIDSILTLTQQLGTPVQDLKTLSRHHPLRTYPFLFAALPIVNQVPINLAYGGGLLLTVGNLSSAWGLDESLSLPRETIRSAQELGINLLHFAWQRRKMMQLIG